MSCVEYVVIHIMYFRVQVRIVYRFRECDGFWHTLRASTGHFSLYRISIEQACLIGAHLFAKWRPKPH